MVPDLTRKRMGPSTLVKIGEVNIVIDTGRGVAMLVLNHIREKSDELLEGVVADVKRDYDGEVIWVQIS